MKLKKRQITSSIVVFAAAIVLAGTSARELIGATALQAETSPPGNDQTIRVGIVQMNARVLDKSYNLKQAEEGIRLAAAQGAKIVVTPEGAVQGYPRVDLHPGESMNDDRLIAERKRILAAAEPIPGPSTERFAELAQKYGVWIVFGMDENRGGRLFNTAVLMNPAGKIEGTYRKVHLQNWMVASGVQHGDGFPVWDIDVDGVRVKVGIEICYDVQHPESTLELALGGAEVVFIPYCTEDFSRPLLIHLFETTALENRLYIVRANYAEPRNTGTSSIINYEGRAVGQLGDRAGVLLGDLDIMALRKVRAAWNPVYGLPNRYPAAYKRLRGSAADNPEP
ncbi:MAG TPA: carbon-nitrogen hydrolase family protein [Terriglobia bacterium]|nr:carbon-nitrogen hydrolase family protein [Terriglobia bacterium]